MQYFWRLLRVVAIVMVGWYILMYVAHGIQIVIDWTTFEAACAYYTEHMTGVLLIFTNYGFIAYFISKELIKDQ